MEDERLADLAHLMRRAGFGASRDELEEYARLGYDAVVDMLVEPESVPDVDADVLERYYFGELFKIRVGEWFYRMLNSRRQLQEKMALFWHHVFATGLSKNEHMLSAANQIATFRRVGLSNLDEILNELSRDPAMIFWLDNNENRKGEPNENYGRELLELFSMGVGSYTEQDIKMASRAFTGWTFTQPIPLYPHGYYPAHFVKRQDDHDNGVKSFLGSSGRLRRRGHHLHDRPTARDGGVHIAAPLQLLRGRRAAGARVAHRASHRTRRPYASSWPRTSRRAGRCARSCGRCSSRTSSSGPGSRR